eukprot:8669076-Pyramimonas_sp.AAC.1
MRRRLSFCSKTGILPCSGARTIQGLVFLASTFLFSRGAYPARAVANNQAFCLDRHAGDKAACQYMKCS